MSAGSEYFPLKGLAALYMRRLVDGEPTGPMIAIHAAQNFDVTPDEEIVPVPGNDVICYEFQSFNKFDIPVNHGAISMEQLPFFMGGDFVDGEDLATFEERTDRQPIPCELWVQTNVAGDGDNSRYYEHFPNCKCLSFRNPRETGNVVQFSSSFSGYVKGAVKRKLFRDKTGTGIPNVDGGDTTPPTILSSDPANAADDHPVGDPIVIQFSEAMNNLSFSGVKLVRESTGLEIDHVAVYAETTGPNTWSLTLTPAAALSAATSYYVFVPSSVQDAAGNRKGAAQFINFTTAA